MTFGSNLHTWWKSHLGNEYSCDVYHRASIALVWWGLQKCVTQTALKETCQEKPQEQEVLLEWGKHRKRKGAGATSGMKEQRPWVPAERCTAPECPAGQQARSESNALSGVSQSPLTFGNARSIIPCTPHSLIKQQDKYKSFLLSVF